MTKLSFVNLKIIFVMSFLNKYLISYNFVYCYLVYIININSIEFNEILISFAENINDNIFLHMHLKNGVKRIKYIKYAK